VRIDNKASRWIALDGAVNARIVVPGVLLRSDNLQALSARDVRVLLDEQGLEVVLDLRTAVEVALEGPSPLSAERTVRIEHRSLYPDAGTGADPGTVLPWAPPDQHESPQERPVVRTYMSYMARRPDSILASIRAIAAADRAVLVHCAAGKDRTGVVVALALDAAGVDRDTIAEDYLATRERIDAVVARLLSSSTYRTDLAGLDPQQLAPAPGTIERLLELIDQRFGGSGAWLSAHGLGDPELERLRHRLDPRLADHRMSGAAS